MPDNIVESRRRLGHIVEERRVIWGHRGVAYKDIVRIASVWHRRDVESIMKREIEARRTASCQFDCNIRKVADALAALGRGIGDPAACRRVNLTARRRHLIPVAVIRCISEHRQVEGDCLSLVVERTERTAARCRGCGCANSGE